MAMDQELERHIETWRGFTRFARWGVAVVVFVLICMAFALL
jgi:hypothetical protein